MGTSLFLSDFAHRADGSAVGYARSIRFAKATFVIDVRNYAATETLKDGTPVIVRSIRGGDRQAVLEAFGHLDRNSVYTRFFTFKKSLTDAELEQLTEVDHEHVVALIATTQPEDPEGLLGGGRYCSGQPLVAARSAELAFMTTDRHHGRGVASLILKHLVLIAREQGLSALEADVLAQNRAMLAVLERSGLPLEQRRESNIVHVRLCLT
jgi:RimJ/RimL family protein N-acetyltransferase